METIEERDLESARKTDYREYTLVDHDKGVTETFESIEDARAAVDESVEQQGDDDKERKDRIIRLSGRIKDCHSKAITYEKYALEAALQCGKEFLALKKELKIDKKARWQTYCTENFPEIKQRTRERYMKLALWVEENPSKLTLFFERCDNLTDAYEFMRVHNVPEKEWEQYLRRAKEEKDHSEAPESDKEHNGEEEQNTAKEYLKIRNQLTKLHTTFSTTLPFSVEKQKELLAPLKMVRKAINDYIAKVEERIVKLQQDKEFDKAA